MSKLHSRNYVIDYEYELCVRWSMKARPKEDQQLCVENPPCDTTTCLNHYSLPFSTSCLDTLTSCCVHCLNFHKYIGYVSNKSRKYHTASIS